MKIKKIEISAYGPVQEFELTPGPFTCIFGRNESGKTALVEALSIILFKKTAAAIRFSKPEHPVVEVEEGGTVYKLPTKRMHPELLPADIANLLYVQASESALYEQRGETTFWEGLKSLFGRFGKGVSFAKLDEKIFKSVGLTPKKEEWAEDKAQRIEIESKRHDELERYLKKISEMETKELDLTHLTKKQKSLRNELRDIENFKNYKNYKELLSLHNAYQERKTELQAYDRYKYEYFDEWQALEVRKESRKRDEEKRKELEEEVATVEREITELNKKKEMVKAFRMLYPAIAFATAIVVFVLSFLFTVPKVLGVILMVLSGAYFIITYRGSVRGKKKIEVIEREKFEKETRRDERKKRIEDLSSGQTAVDVKRRITELRDKTGLAELADLKEKIAEKRKLDDTLSALNAKLFMMLSEKNDKKWQRMVNESKTTKPDTEPDIDREKDIRIELEKNQETINDLRSEITVFRDTLKEKFDIPDDRAAFIEVSKLQKKLANYELERKAALIARNILKKMSSEMDEFIQDIITGDESLSEYFKLITDRYEEIEVKDKNFVVKQKDGRKFKIDELSSGAQDQLLLCFRIAALKKIYPEGSFLILDDAFIFADWDRRPKLVELLKKFIDDGNQVIYLTSDDHTRDLLKDSGAQVTTL